MITNKTYQPKAKDVKREWHLVDAKGKVLGRMATNIARLLIGKHKVTYAPHMDAGDYVVVINAKDVKVTGHKEKQKVYYRHSGYPGGLKSRTLAEQREKQPTKIIELAVRNMLPKNRLQSKRMGRLKVVVGEQHPYNNKFEARNSKSETSSK